MKRVADRVRAWRALWGQRFDRGTAESRMDEEMRFHLEMEMQKNVEAGLSPAEARRRALLAFGGIERHREAMRDYRKLPLEDLGRDASFALRSLFRRPALASLSVLTMGVAIGATTAIFSVVDGVLLSPLPYPDADELVTVRLEVEIEEREDISFSDRGFWHFHDGNRSFERFGGFSYPVELPLVGDGEPVQLTAAAMTLDAFEAMGVRPVLGRLPTPREDETGATTVALISEGLWRGRFGGDSAIVGRTIDLRGAGVEVIGVMPASYDFPTPTTDVWYPYRLDPASENWGGHHIQVVARLRDGVSLESARAEAAGLIGRIGEAGYDPGWVNEVFTGRATIETIKDGIVGTSRRPLYVVLGTVGLVLVVACGNLANLLLARAESRSRERAMRSALGASRRRLVRDVFVESFAIAFLGGLLGFVLALAGTRVLVALGPPVIPRLDEIRARGTVLLFTTAVVVGATLLIGLAPALRVARERSIATLRDAGKGATIGRDRHRIRGALVVAQVALTVVLLVGSGLLVRTYRELRAVDAGFRSEGLLTFGVYLPGSRYPDVPSTFRFLDQMVERLEALPGVASAGATSTLPLTDRGSLQSFRVGGVPIAEGAVEPEFSVRRITPSYFRTMGIPLIEGRAFGPADREQGPPPVIISASLAEQYWPDRSALGARLDSSRIVGVVGDVHDGGLTSPPEQIVYLPQATRGWQVVVRTAAEPTRLTPAVRQTIAGIDPLLPISDVRTMEEIVDASISGVTFTASLLVLAAIIALFLGAVGLLGVVGYVVAQRTAEMGIRQALGARPAQLLRLVLRQSMALVTLGVVIGAVMATWMRSSLSTLVYGIDLLDPPSFIVGSLVLFAVATVASLVPAMRAARVQPAAALRHD